MRVETLENKTEEIVEYDSLNEFYKYICDTPFNESFRWANHVSVSGSRSFTQTANFEEATELFKNGWSDMSNKLTQKLNVIKNQVQPHTRPKTFNSVQGYQALVPLYLQGCPTNMVNKKMVPVKQKVVTLNKSVNYNCGVTIEQIVEESTKALQIVKKLEAQGYRVNLNIMWSIYDGNKKYVVKIRIKNACEKMNVSKLSFPLVHPSMMRRLLFRWLEVFPGVPKCFTNGYGIPMKAYDMRKYMGKGEYLLPSFINKDVNQINNIDDLENV